jgi:hypothetical protein
LPTARKPRAGSALERHNHDEAANIDRERPASEQRLNLAATDNSRNLAKPLRRIATHPAGRLALLNWEALPADRAGWVVLDDDTGQVRIAHLRMMPAPADMDSAATSCALPIASQRRQPATDRIGATSTPH